MHKFNLGLKLFAPKSFHVNTQLWSPSSVLLSGAKNQSSSHRHRVPASKPLDNETMQGNVQHQWTYTSCPRLPVFTEIFPVIFMMLPGYTHVHSCIFDTFWWLSKNTTNQISQTLIRHPWYINLLLSSRTRPHRCPNFTSVGLRRKRIQIHNIVYL